MSKNCAVENCPRELESHGYCRSHYARWYRWGNPLAGRPFRDNAPGTETCQAEGCTKKPRSGTGKGSQLCSAHLHRLNRYGDPNGHPENYVAEDAESKTCTECFKSFPIDSFGRSSQGRLGLKAVCRSCDNDRGNSWRSSLSPEKKKQRRAQERKSRILKAYGEAGLEADKRIQAGEDCDICSERTPRMAIDHDHETGQVRGVLCRDCNLILGWVKDDPVRLRAMADYLS